MSRKYALEGLKVANFAWVGVGPLHARYLANHGATVVRVESHTRPDTIRLQTPFKGGIPGVNNGPWFREINNSVYSLSINLNKPTGKEIAWKLVMWADVMLESFTPGTTKRWELDYESVARKRPDMVYVSTCQMGQTGPYATFAGFGYQSTAIAGFTSLCGWPDREPTPTQGAYTDFIAPRFGAVALMAALDHRRRTGEGQYIDQSQFETSCHFLATPITDFFTNGRVQQRLGNHHPHAAPHSAYPCKGNDRWCAISVFTDEEWLAFVEVVDEDWICDERFATLFGRKENEEELDTLIGGWTIGYTAEQVELKMQARGIAASAVMSTRDLMEDAHLRHQDFLKLVEHHELGFHRVRSSAFSMSKTEQKVFGGPTLGEHNEYVLKELLGMNADQIADALADGGITTEADLPEITAAL